MIREIRKPVTVAEWDAMAPEEQDALIASGWHPGPGAYSDRALQVRYARRDRDFWKARAEAAERELARLQEGLRPESLARLFHETYERLAPDHGYKTREDSAVLWEDVPAANRALMIATADAVARALLADTAEPKP